MKQIGIVIGLSLSLFAQNLDEIIQYSIANHAKVKALEIEISQLQNNVKLARTWENPTLSLGYNALYILDPLYRNDMMQSISIGVSQKIDLFAKKPLEGEKIDLQKEIKILELKSLKKEIVRQIKISMIKKYQDAYRAHILNSTIKNLEIFKNQLNLSSTQSSLAQIYKIEILQTRLRIRLRQIIESEKNQLINLSESTFGEFEDIAFEERFEKDFSKDYYKKSYELQILKLQERIGQKDVALAKRSFWSDPMLNVGYFHRDKHPDFVSFSLSFSLPIYGKEGLALENSKKQIQLIRDSYLDRENAIKGRIGRLLNIIANKKEELKLVESILIPENQKLVTLSKQNLSSNLASMNDYHTAINDLLESKLLKIEILGSIWSALAELESIGGE